MVAETDRRLTEVAIGERVAEGMAEEVSERALRAEGVKRPVEVARDGRDRAFGCLG